VTFRRLAADAEAALRAADPAPAEEALALIIDLACEMKDSQYFRSENPGGGGAVRDASPPRSAPTDTSLGRCSAT
jgi:hypothetical protein